MKRSQLYYLSLFIMFIPVIKLHADSPPLKYGKVSKEELAMTVYDGDSSAAAVLLCDYGYFHAANFEFRRVLRVKILRKEGYYWADKVFPIARKDQSVHVRGMTYNLIDGEIEKTKLKSESIFKERLSENLYRYHISMPAVKVGSVFDIEFTYPRIPEAWYFQQDIPVKLSVLIMEKSEYVSFRKSFCGYEPLAYASDHQWVAKNIPAFKPEPFINSPENYISKVEFDILNISFPGYYYNDVTTSWDEVAEYLDDSKYFGVAMRAAGYMRQEANILSEKYPEPSEELLKEAFEFIKDFHWNDQYSIYTSKESISYMYSDKSGNSADVNLALVQLLKKLGFAANPVVLSARKNGLLSPYKPSINKLDFVIAQVVFKEKEYLLDATEKYAPFYLLPPKCLNGFGYEVIEDKSKQISLAPSKKAQKMVFSTLQLNQDLSLEGSIKISQKDYAALEYRKTYFDFASQDNFLDHIIQEHPGLRISNYEVENLNHIYSPIKENYEVKLKNQLEEVDDELHLYPMVFDRLVKNPFHLEERKYPIDYGYTSSATYIASIAIPENFKIKSIPEKARVELPEDAVDFTYQVTQLGQNLQFVFKVNINKTLILQDQYKLLKEWYNQMLLKHAEPIVLEHI